MIEFLNWFQINYSEIKKEMQGCNHNFDNTNTNPCHVEGDCWSHTMLVCKIAELKGYDRVVQITALLHDIGKPQARKINSENGYVEFFGHEEISVKMAEPLVSDLVKRGLLTKSESLEVLELIALHSYLYMENDPEKIYNRFKDNIKLFKHLVEFGICDDYGRFSEDMGKSNLDTDAIIKRIERNNYQDTF